jgi:hypothetical protein
MRQAAWRWARSLPPLLAILAVAAALLLPGVHASHEDDCDHAASGSECVHRHDAGEGTHQGEQAPGTPHDEHHCSICRLIAMIGTVAGSALAAPALTLIAAPVRAIESGLAAPPRSCAVGVAHARGPPAA